MTKVPFEICLSDLVAEASHPDLPVAFLDLGKSGDVPERLTLPPFPVIGFGAEDHLLARWCDTIIEPPVTARNIARNIERNPLAAQAITGLLRAIPALCLNDALCLESMTYAMLQGSAEHARWLDGLKAEPPVEQGKVALSRNDGTLTITLNSPATGNVIDRAMRDALYEAFTLARLDEQIGRVVLLAKGRTFSLGSDLSEFGTTRDPATAHSIRLRTLPAHQAAPLANKMEAQINGACIGAGLEMAAWAKRIVASPRAWFQLPELAMGILPGAGGCVSLTRRIGRQRAALMIFSGQRISACHALDWGLVDAIEDFSS